jgi:hypothetical protein
MRAITNSVVGVIRRVDGKGAGKTWSWCEEKVIRRITYFDFSIIRPLSALLKFYLHTTPSA